MHKLHFIICLLFWDVIQCPPMTCLNKFNGYSIWAINSNLEFNCAYRHALRAESNLYQHLDSYREVIKEASRCYDAWDNLRDAKSNFYAEEAKRRALWRLRQIIGDERFYAGGRDDRSRAVLEI